VHVLVAEMIPSTSTVNCSLGKSSTMVDPEEAVTVNGRLIVGSV
jgi:hypothetical protein